MKDRIAMKRILKDERGIALFMVLWVMALLTIIAGEFCYAIRTEANITRNFKEETQTYYIAVSGISWAIEGLVVDDLISRSANRADGKEQQEALRRRINTESPAVPFGGGQFKVETENESGKVNLNRAGDSLLRMMLTHFEMTDADKKIIVDSIMDWRDEDYFLHTNGAEDEYYLSLPKPYRCKNGDFTSIDELLLVRGVTPEIFYGGLKDMVTVYQDKKTDSERDSQNRARIDYSKININAASTPILRSLPLMTEDAIHEIMKYREKKDIHSYMELYPIVGSDVYAAIWPYISFGLSPYYKIKSVGMLKESRTRQGVQVLVKIDGTLSKGYEIIEWIDNLEY